MAAVLLAVLLAPRAANAVDEVMGARALGMGGSLRAAATGAAGIYLNPSGLALVRQYAIEATYGYRPQDSAQVVGIAVTDSQTSRVAAGLYYTFLDAAPSAGRVDFDRRVHEAGLTLAMPFLDRISLGVTNKVIWARVIGAGVEFEPTGHYTVDTAVTVRVLRGLSLAAVGQNLRDLESREMPVMLGLGASYSFGNRAVLAFDTTIDFTSYESPKPLFRGGGEILLGGHATVRAGFGRDQANDATSISFGVGYVGPNLAVDSGLQQQVQGGAATYIGTSVRVFLQ